VGRFVAACADVRPDWRFERSGDYWGSGKTREYRKRWYGRQRVSCSGFDAQPVRLDREGRALGSVRLHVDLTEDVPLAEKLADQIVRELGVSVEILH